MPDHGLPVSGRRGKGRLPRLQVIDLAQFQRPSLRFRPFLLRQGLGLIRQGRRGQIDGEGEAFAGERPPHQSLIDRLEAGSGPGGRLTDQFKYTPCLPGVPDNGMDALPVRFLQASHPVSLLYSRQAQLLWGRLTQVPKLR